MKIERLSEYLCSKDCTVSAMLTHAIFTKGKVYRSLEAGILVGDGSVSGQTVACKPQARGLDVEAYFTLVHPLKINVKESLNKDLNIKEGKRYLLKNGFEWVCYEVFPMQFEAIGAFFQPLLQTWVAMTVDLNGENKGGNRDYDITGEYLDKIEFDFNLISFWFKGIAMDEDGKWYAYSNTPSRQEDYFNNEEDGGIYTELPKSVSPKWKGNWKESWLENPYYKKL